MKNCKILIIDDDVHIRQLLEINLRAASYDVVSCTNGKEALDKIKIEKPDLVILDIMMPEIDGLEVCKIIKDDPEIENIKVIMLTARGSAKDKMICKDILKADEYMSKPFEMDNLLSVIKDLLNARC